MIDVISLKRLILIHPSGYTLYPFFQLPEAKGPLPGVFSGEIWSFQ